MIRQIASIDILPPDFIYKSLVPLNIDLWISPRLVDSGSPYVMMITIGKLTMRERRTLRREYKLAAIKKVVEQGLT